MAEEQKIVNNLIDNHGGMVTGSYFAGMILDPAGPPHDIGWSNRKKLRIIFEYPEDVEEVTRALVKYYFRPGIPHMYRRIQLSNHVYELLQDMHIEEIISYDRCN